MSTTSPSLPIPMRKTMTGSRVSILVEISPGSARSNTHRMNLRHFSFCLLVTLVSSLAVLLVRGLDVDVRDVTVGELGVVGVGRVEEHDGELAGLDLGGAVLAALEVAGVEAAR